MAGPEEHVQASVIVGTLDPSWSAPDDAFSAETESALAAVFTMGA